MQQLNPARGRHVPLGGNVVMLQPAEAVELDQDRVVELFIDMGEIGAQQAVSDALAELRTLVAGLEQEYRAGSWRGLADLGSRISVLAGNIGFVSCQRAAQGVVSGARDRRAGDMPALLARLTRVCALPCPSYWDMHDQSG